MPVERFGPYVVLEELASGGMGRVLLARSPGGRTVAVKTLLTESEDDRRRFAREVRIAQRVRGVYTASVVEADVEASVPWMATEYVPAPSLRDLVERCGVLGPDALSWLAAGIAEALLSIREAGLVHRDVKPSNVLLPLDGPRVIDFGISQAHDVTQTRAALGTVLYASPEQARGEPTTPASDVFSLGVTLFHLAVGRAPYRDGGADGALAQLVRTAAGELDVSGLPAELEPLVLPCLELDAARRPGAADVLARCQGVLAARPEARGGEDWLPPAWTEAIERHRRYRVRAVRDAAERVARKTGAGAPRTDRLTRRLAGRGSPPARRWRVPLLGAGAVAAAGVVGTAVWALGPWNGGTPTSVGVPDGPVSILPVEAVSPGVCRADSPPGRSWTADDRQTCVVTKDDGGMTVRRFEDVRAETTPDSGGAWSVRISLRASDRAAFSRLTGGVAGRGEPHDQLAFVLRDSSRLLVSVRVLEQLDGPGVTIAIAMKENEARFLAQALGARPS
ncbi:serine/threonine-protein kinase [Streptomyces alkaliterrae]|uniref:Serine/threonine protein kinase n=1 Tax=Streptomyces alkaliterrae TaxID=2213162 RepID=A0A7W3ZUA7_9ACTN|nr:serine/threonine-protein kinase [Streptomyces alkaliterrae]MBB1260607.1 serine/threonine protein kinase [Streptomyces alkaliterrae]